MFANVVFANARSVFLGRDNEQARVVEAKSLQGP